MDIFKLLLDLVKGGIKKRWIVLLLFIVTLWFVGSKGKFSSYGGEPNWSEVKDEKSIRIESDISLKGGELTISPQIVVKYNEVIFMIINVRGVYCSNTVQLENKETKSFFCLKYSSDAREKLKDFQEIIYKMIIEEGERLAIQQVSSCDCEFEWVADVSYQNLKRNRARTRQLLYSSGMIERICDEERSYRNSQLYVNINNSGVKEDIEQNEEITNNIREILKEIKTEV